MFGCSSFPCPSRTVALTQREIAYVVVASCSSKAFGISFVFSFFARASVSRPINFRIANEFLLNRRFEQETYSDFGKFWNCW